jgi:hypothetical protein
MATHAYSTPARIVRAHAELLRLRTAVQNEIQRSIDLLDRFDGDPDLEGAGTEYLPDLMATRVYDTDCEPDVDGEPDLGWPGVGEGFNPARELLYEAQLGLEADYETGLPGHASATADQELAYGAGR